MSTAICNTDHQTSEGKQMTVCCWSPVHSIWQSCDTSEDVYL